MNSSKHTELANHAWSVADLLRGDYKQSDYGKVILPFTVLRRLECVLEPTREKVTALAEQYKDGDIDPDRFLRRAAGHSFYNKSGLTLKKIAADPQSAAKNLTVYVGSFSDNARGVLDRFEFAQQIKRLDSSGLLYQVIGKFTDLDLRPEVVSNHNMGYIFEELIRRFAEQSNKTAGEHFTPREIIQLMVRLLVAPDGDGLQLPGVVRTVMDPACGTGGDVSRRKGPGAHAGPLPSCIRSGSATGSHPYEAVPGVGTDRKAGHRRLLRVPDEDGFNGCGDLDAFSALTTAVAALEPR